MTSFGVLGPVTADAGAGPVALKGPRHRAVLARLLIARGRVVPVDRLVGDLWDVPPDRAVGAIQTFVSDLRRALEPDRAPREPARTLVTAPPGYLLRAPADAVDAGRFEAALTRSADLPAGPALSSLDEALALWRGPAYAEFAGAGWARAEIDRLDELRMLAVERRGEALLALGRAAEAASALQAHAEGHPLREDAWHLLATALYRAGRQGDALAALRRVRGTLVAELGVDPGPRLRRVEADILAQAPHLADPPPVVDRAPFFGRDDEMAQLEQAARSARTGPVLALVSGEAGAGKTALVEALERRLAARGWTTAWGRAPEYEGASVASPWTQISAALPGPAAGGSDPRAAVDRLSAVARRTPVLLVFDDLHRADDGTLELIGALAAERVLVVGTYRSTEISAPLTAALARFAGTEPVRVYLGGLTAAATGALARSVAGPEVDAELIHRRSGGNPFFVRELARLFAAGGSSALQEIPAGVRDVIRHRLTALPPSARTILRQASVIGRDIDPDLLVALAGDEVLDAVDGALRAGFLTEDPLRFTHILVRDTLYDDLSALRRAHWHAAAARELERLRPDEAEALAHHFLAGGDPERAGVHARVAAVRAEQRFDPHAAVRWWRQALDSGAADRPGAVIGLARGLAVTGHLDEARRRRAEAITQVAGFDVPAIWVRNDDEDLSRQIVAAAERDLAALPADDDARRSRLLSTIALELRGITSGRGDRAAREAESIARAVGEPALLAFALNARFMHSFSRAGLAASRAEIGAELIELSARHGLVSFEVLGRLIVLQSHCALGDRAAADAQAEAVDRLADRHDLPLIGVFTEWYAALRLACDADAVAAEAAYRSADVRLAASGMPGMAEGLLPLALLSLRPEGAPLDDLDGWGPYEPWVRPLVLLSEDRRDEAAAALRDLPESPHDPLREARLCLAARAAIALDDRDTMARLHAQLRPAAHEGAGAASGVLTFGPVAGCLDRLATQ
jgi:DNA-binding SARP family transcriptional activator